MRQGLREKSFTWRPLGVVIYRMERGEHRFDELALRFRPIRCCSSPAKELGRTFRNVAGLAVRACLLWQARCPGHLQHFSHPENRRLFGWGDAAVFDITEMSCR